jgi:far upstream element-binding protein
VSDNFDNVNYQQQQESYGVLDNVDPSIKRKREEENSQIFASNSAELEIKKIKAEEAQSYNNVNLTNNNQQFVNQGLIPSTAQTSGPESIIIEVTQDKVGQIIGSKGAIIQEIQTRTGARAFVNQDFPPGVNRQVNISGTPQQVKAAADLIRLIIEQGPTSIHLNSLTGGPTIHSIIECTQSVVGRVIGTGGATIKDLQSKTGAKIQIEQDFPPEVPRKINITGTSAAVTLAIQLINRVIESGSLNPTPSLPVYGGNMFAAPQPNMYGHAVPAYTPTISAAPVTTQVVDIPKAFVGKVIGKGGETITLIQQKCGAKCMVDQNVPEGQPCKVIMTGMAANLAMVNQLISEIMMNVPTHRLGANLPPLPTPGAANPANPYGNMQMPQAYGMPYGGMQPVPGAPQQVFFVYFF